MRPLYLFFAIKRKGAGDLIFTSIFAIITALVMLHPITVNGQEQSEYDEVSVALTVPRVGNAEIPAIIINQKAYLQIKELFDYLRIKNTPSSNMDSISGFILNPQFIFLIDQVHNQIRFQDKNIELKPGDLLRSDNNLYLKSDYFGDVFGLQCSFNFRNLAVTINALVELPAIRDMKLDLMHRNINQLKGEKKADTTIRRNFSLFHLGNADWSVTAMQQKNGISNMRAAIAIGGVIAGGETNVYLNSSNNQPFDPRQQYFRWRYVNNDQKALRQVTLGRIVSPSVSTLYAPLNGVQFTNSPTLYRRSFGSYRLTNTTEPGWTVELYVNNVLVNYVKADAFGFYSIDVPMFYGNSVMKLCFYGPWGEEKIREQNVNVPFSFLPYQHFEYTLTGGILDDEQKSRYSRANFNYGLSKRLTISAGMEYLSSLYQGRFMPFINSSYRLGNNIIFSGEQSFGVRSKGLLNYRTASGLEAEVNFIKYAKGQDAIKTNNTKEMNASLTFPLQLKTVNTLSRFTYNHYTVFKSQNTNAEFLISASGRRISANLTTSVAYSNPSYPYIYSNLSFTFPFAGGIRFTPQIQYGYQQQNLTKIKMEAEKRVSANGAFTFTYEKNTLARTTLFGLGLRMNFSFASTSLSASHSGNVTTVIETASGSLVHDGKTHYTQARRYNSVSKGGIAVVAFLDLNCNGKRDAHEPNVPGLKFRINGGHLVQDEDGFITRVLDLEAYTNYFIEVENGSFDNIAWQIKNKTIKIIIEPNQLRLVEIPVAVVGEVSGMINLKSGNAITGLSRIIVNIFDSSSVLVARTLSEQDGYFSYLGLPPGLYKAKLDSGQLHHLNFIATPDSISFTVASSKDGVIADGFIFIIRSIFESPVNNSTQTAGKMINKINDSTVTHNTEQSISNPSSIKKHKAVLIGHRENTDTNPINKSNTSIPVSGQKIHDYKITTTLNKTDSGSNKRINKQTAMPKPLPGMSISSSKADLKTPATIYQNIFDLNLPDTIFIYKQRNTK